VTLENVEIVGIPRFGVVVGEKGVLKGLNSALKDCGIGGVCTIGGSAEFEVCTFAQNGLVGIKCQGGAVKLSRCEVSSHQIAGVFVQGDGEFSENNTKWAENEQNVVGP
jgi:hypothetical protein